MTTIESKKLSRGRTSPKKAKRRSPAKKRGRNALFSKCVEVFNKLESKDLKTLSSLADGKDVSGFVSPMTDYFLSTREVFRSQLGSKPYVIDIGGATTIATTAASVMNFATIGAVSYIGMVPSGTSVVNWASYINLFDEIKIMGVRGQFVPYNQNNHGAATNAGVAVLWFDDDRTALPTVTTLTPGISELVDRGHMCKVFSLDKAFSYNFSRHDRMGDVSWVDLQAMVTTPGSGTAGSLNVGTDVNQVTASTLYGTVTYLYEAHFRMRL